MNDYHKPALAIDLDDTCFNYFQGFCDYIQTLGYKIPPNVIMHEFNMETTGMIPLGSFEYLHRKAVDNGLFQNLKPLPGAVKVLQDLSNRGYEINIVTSRLWSPGQHDMVLQQTAKALDSSGIPYDNILFLHQKWRFSADTYIDDAPHNIIALRNANRHVIAYEQTYNQSIPNVERAKNWNEIDLMLRERYGR